MKIRKYKWVIITLLIVIGIMVMIFLFSNQTRSDSDVVSGFFTKRAVKLYSFLYNLLPHEAGNGPVISTGHSLYEDLNHYIRKLGHMTEYAVLSAALMAHLTSIWNVFRDNVYTLPPKAYVLYSTLIATIYAVTDEFHQSFVPGRGPQAKDVLIDFAGGIIGAFILYLIIKKLRKSSDKG